MSRTQPRFTLSNGPVLYTFWVHPDKTVLIEKTTSVGPWPRPSVLSLENARRLWRQLIDQGWWKW